MSLRVGEFYDVCCAVSMHVGSHSTSIVVMYLEKNLWEYSADNWRSSDLMDKYTSWQEFLSAKWRRPYQLQWVHNMEGEQDYDCFKPQYMKLHGDWTKKKCVEEDESDSENDYKYC